MERHVHDLEKEIMMKDAALSTAMMDVDRLRIDNVSLSKLEAAYSEVLNHNRSLIDEIDRLNSKINDVQQDKVKIEHEYNKSKTYESRLNESNRKIEQLSNELVERNREIASYQRRVEEYRDSYQSQLDNLNNKIKEIQDEREQIRMISDEYYRENEFLRSRIDEESKIFREHTENVKKQIEYEKKTILEREKAELNGKFNLEKFKLDQQVQQYQSENQELNGKLEILIAEYEKLQEQYASKSEESEQERFKNLQLLNDLEMIRAEKAADIERVILEQEKEFKIAKMEMANELHRLRGEKDTEKKQALEFQARELASTMIDQKSQFEEKIIFLTAQNEKLKEMNTHFEKELSSMKSQHEYNEKLLEKKLTHTAEAEIRQVQAKFILERDVIEKQLEFEKHNSSKLESQLILVTSELDKIANLYKSRLSEIDDLKSKLIISENDRKMQIEDLKIKLDADKTREFDQIRTDLTRAYDSQLEVLKKKCSDFENKFYTVIEENRKLVHVNEDRMKEVENWKMQMNIATEKHKQEFQSVVANLENERQREINNITVQSQNEITMLESQKAELEKRCQNYEMELARLNALVVKNIDENRNLKNQYDILERQRNADISSLNEQFENYKRANIDVNNLQIRFEAEKSSLLSQIYQQKEKIQELEKRIILINSENERMRTSSDEKVAEHDRLNRRIIELEDQLENKTTLFESNVESAKRAGLEIQEITIKSNSDKAQYENQIRQLKNMYENGKTELENLYKLMDQRKKDSDQNLKQIDDLKKQVEKLNSQLRHNERDHSSKKDKDTELMMKIEQLGKERDIYKSQNENLSVELNRTNSELYEKIKELDSLKHKYEQSMEISSKLNSQIISKLMKHE